jgi:hypothetical protein
MATAAEKESSVSLQQLIQYTCRLRFTYWTLKGTDNDPSKKGSFLIYIILQYSSEQKENTKKENTHM